MDRLELIYDLIKDIRETQQEMSDEISEIKIVQAKQSVILEENAKDIHYHIKRTDLLEKALEKHKNEQLLCQKECTTNKVASDNKFQVSETVRNISIVAGLLLTLTGIIAAIRNLF